MLQTERQASDSLQNLLRNNYLQQVERASLESDPAQISIIEHLQTLLEQLIAINEYTSKHPLQRLLMVKPAQAKNIYIFGNVGRGKSMLMDLFFQVCPIKQKRRVHFLTFMQEVHEFVHQRRLEKKYDAIPALAKKIRASALVLCFDEFHVHDIADTMIMGRLFTQLFDLGLVIVATSNIHPDDLYRGGIQRDSFLPFISLLKQTSKVCKLDAQKDYRCSFQTFTEQSYYWPLDQNADALLLEHFSKLTQNAPREIKTLSILGRQLSLTVANDETIYSNFKELCGQTLGPADYLAIAQQFKHIFITDIPELTRRQLDEAKRFVMLIDALYEHKVKLICSAEISPDKLYIKGKNAFEFKRTISRLNEMQSLNYWHTEHIPS